MTAGILGLLIGSPAAAQTVQFGFSIPWEDGDVATGDVSFGPSGIRTFDDDLFVYFPGNLADGTGGDVATANGASMSRTAGAAVARAESAVGGGSPVGETVDVNTLNEVIYDLENNLRMEVDHERRTVNTRPIVNAPTDGSSILAGAPDGASQEQLSALGDLLNTFTQDRPDPMSDVELVELNTEGVAEVGINGVSYTVPCANYQANERSGATGRMCMADPEAIPNGQDILAAIHQLPLAGADGNDFAGWIRRLSDMGKIPLAFFNDQLTPPGGPDLPVTVSYIRFSGEDVPRASDPVVGDAALDDYTWTDR
jgi:hypothetical protein